VLVAAAYTTSCWLLFKMTPSYMVPYFSYDAAKGLLISIPIGSKSKKILCFSYSCVFLILYSKGSLHLYLSRGKPKKTLSIATCQWSFALHSQGAALQNRKERSWKTHPLSLLLLTKAYTLWSCVGGWVFSRKWSLEACLHSTSCSSCDCIATKSW
jgi:hypothetical protein